MITEKNNNVKESFLLFHGFHFGLKAVLFKPLLKFADESTLTCYCAMCNFEEFQDRTSIFAIR